MAGGQSSIQTHRVHVIPTSANWAEGTNQDYRSHHCMRTKSLIRDPFSTAHDEGLTAITYGLRLLLDSAIVSRSIATTWHRPQQDPPSVVVIYNPTGKQDDIIIILFSGLTMLLLSSDFGRVVAYNQEGDSQSNRVLPSFAGILTVASIQHMLPVVKAQGLHYVAVTES